MLRIRLTRVGKKKQPHYRVVVADIEAPRDGRIVERIGYYSPLTESDLVDIDEERALYWLSVGARPTETVRSLLRRQGTLHRLSRLHAGEEMEALIAEYKQETGQAEAEPAVVAPAATEEAEDEEAEEVEETEEETVVEEPATEVGEAYTEAAEEADVVDEVAEATEEAVDTAAEAVEDATDAVVDTTSDAAEAALEAVEEFIGSEEEE